jgi:hypothetical protein
MWVLVQAARQDQLPGRVAGHQTTESVNAGPVNCIRSRGEVRYR